MINKKFELITIKIVNNTVVCDYYPKFTTLTAQGIKTLPRFRSRVRIVDGVYKIIGYNAPKDYYELMLVERIKKGAFTHEDST